MLQTKGVEPREPVRMPSVRCHVAQGKLANTVLASPVQAARKFERRNVLAVSQESRSHVRSPCLAEVRQDQDFPDGLRHVEQAVHRHQEEPARRGDIRNSPTGPFATRFWSCILLHSINLPHFSQLSDALLTFSRKVLEMQYFGLHRSS